MNTGIELFTWCNKLLSLSFGKQLVFFFFSEHSVTFFLYIENGQIGPNLAASLFRVQFSFEISLSSKVIFIDLTMYSKLGLL